MNEFNDYQSGYIQNMYTYFTSRFINVDCSTEKYHNDNDAGSTIIKVPNQDKEHIDFV